MRLAFRFGSALLLLGAGTASAVPSFGPQGSARVQAGDVEVAVLEPARGGVEERELVLSLDGGKSFLVRLTAEIGLGDLRALWRVPELPTDHAVLALREGSRGSEEKLVASSAEFTILPVPGSAAEELRFRNGEWKTREADTGSDDLPAPSIGRAAPVHCERLIPGCDAFEAPDRALPVAPDGFAIPSGAPATGDGAGGSPPVRLSPLFSPRRE